MSEKKQIKSENKSEKKKKDSEKNPMQEIFVEKLILHATTTDPEKLEKYKKLIEYITDRIPAITKARKRIQQFKTRKGLTIGYKVTLRKKEALEMLKILLAGIKYKIKETQIGNGTVNFGIKEYIQVPGIEYRRDIGILGFDVAVVLAKRGKRVENRKIKSSKVGKRQQVAKDETVKFMKEKFDVKID